MSEVTRIAPCGVEVQPGQMWEEVDPRLTKPRTVRVVEVTTRYQGRAYTSMGRTLEDVVCIEHAGRKTYAKLSRFNGKRGGYRLTASPV